MSVKGGGLEIWNITRVARMRYISNQGYSLARAPSIQTLRIHAAQFS